MTRPARLAVALDVADRTTAVAMAAALRGHVDIVKLGLELFVAEGPALVAELAGDGWPIFLDLKLHDIPATVAGAVRGASDLGAEFLTPHAAGGPRMIEAAAQARRRSDTPRLLGVTVLTSLDAEQVGAVGFSGSLGESVERLARLATESGCDGVVASPQEVTALRGVLGGEPLIVTAGIRPSGADVDDQARVATAADAVTAGADMLVVGRPILKAEDPAAAADLIRREMEEADARRG